MEKINDISQIYDLKENLIWLNQDSVSISNTQIVFEGTNNLFYIEDGVKIANSKFFFRSSNSIIYLSSNHNTYYLNCSISNNSVIFMGKGSYTNGFHPAKLLNIIKKNHVDYDYKDRFYLG